jgi:ABC-2 type transport system ATP-binding protein
MVKIQAIHKEAMELNIRDVSKTDSKGVQALKDVTLTIPPWMYSLLGPNVAGKSTLMRILAKFRELDEGSIGLGDIDVVNRKDEVRRTLGYLPQEFGVFPKVSAIDWETDGNVKAVRVQNWEL